MGDRRCFISRSKKIDRGGRYRNNVGRITTPIAQPIGISAMQNLAMRILAMIVLIVAVLFSAGAQAQLAQAAPADAFCPQPYPPETPPSESTPHGTLTIMPATRWQPVGGEIQFELTGMEKPPEDVRVYFSWALNRGKAGFCHRSQRVRLLPNPTGASDSTYLYAAKVPPFEHPSPWFEGIGHWENTSTVPTADLYVYGFVRAGAVTPVAFVLTNSVGITTPLFAIALAGGAALITLLVPTILWRRRKVSGWFLLRIITTPNGVASLSQFQILIWTFVIATGAVYVMLLTGYLIDIPTATLGLLGISGAALVGSKLTTGADGSPQRVSAPGAVTNLDAVGTPTSSTVVLTWALPAGTPQPFSYTIQKRPTAGGPWETVKNDVGGPPYAVIDLGPATQYDFQVFAINPGGAGPACVPITRQTAAGAAAAVGGPGQVTGLQATAGERGPIELTWTTMAPAPDSYTVQYRKVGTLAWATYSTSASSPALVAGLDAGTQYELHVFAVAGGVSGSPSLVAGAKTRERTPRWSDLVMSGDDHLEVDPARVQMLVFTSIAAVFTGLTLINTGTIPEIPVGVLALVGVSNGVYLASKVAGR